MHRKLGRSSRTFSPTYRAPSSRSRSRRRCRSGQRSHPTSVTAKASARSTTHKTTTVTGAVLVGDDCFWVWRGLRKTQIEQRHIIRFPLGRRGSCFVSKVRPRLFDRLETQNFYDVSRSFPSRFRPYGVRGSSDDCDHVRHEQQALTDAVVTSAERSLGSRPCGGRSSPWPATPEGTASRRRCRLVGAVW
jgi:hypothetical protein